MDKAIKKYRLFFKSDTLTLRIVTQNAYKFYFCKLQKTEKEG